MSEDAPDLEDVQQKLDEIQSRKRESIRWSMSRHTAERAIEAIIPSTPAGARDTHTAKSVGGGNTRRRKRRKRLL